ncbi:MAG: DnaJ C-terminal domain-containing protein, partial [Bradymonadia bacterium]
GQDISVKAEASLECIATGGDLEVTYRRLSRCDSCEGSGCKPGARPLQCGTCGGGGHVRGQGFFSLPRTCGTCQGRGHVITDPCLKCQGAGRAKSPVTLRVPVPLGMTDGYRLRVDGEGHEGSGGGQNGDLYIVISHQAHEQFTRQGADLHCTVPISFPKAALGGVIFAPTLGEPVKIKVPQGTDSGNTLRVKGRGLPHLNGTALGHLYVTLRIQTPSDLSSEQRSLLEAFEASLSPSDEKQLKNSPGLISWFKRLF